MPPFFTCSQGKGKAVTFTAPEERAGQPLTKPNMKQKLSKLGANRTSKQREVNARWANAALGKQQSARYGDKLYDKSMEVGNYLKFIPKEKKENQGNKG